MVKTDRGRLRRRFQGPRLRLARLLIGIGRLAVGIRKLSAVAAHDAARAGFVFLAEVEAQLLLDFLNEGVSLGPQGRDRFLRLVIRPIAAAHLLGLGLRQRQQGGHFRRAGIDHGRITRRQRVSFALDNLRGKV